MTHFQSLFIQNLRVFRTKAGVTQLEFSEKIGISPNYLNAVENGKNFPFPEVIQKVIDILKISPYLLFVESQIDIEKSGFSETQMQRIYELKEKVKSAFDELLTGRGIV